jgi:hypothetical protein
MLTPANTLAARRGLSLCHTNSSHQFYLIDNVSGFPAINSGRDTLSFTLEEAVEFLDPSTSSSAHN